MYKTIYIQVKGGNLLSVPIPCGSAPLPGTNHCSQFLMDPSSDEL